MSVYGATKAALVLLTKSWAAEFGPHGVRVNAVIVGPTRSSQTPRNWATHLSSSPRTRLRAVFALADEIASAVDYLVSESASFIHGAALPVDGGRTAV